MLSDLEQAVDLPKDSASRALFGSPVIGAADHASLAGSRIKNALGHAVLPPWEAESLMTCWPSCCAPAARPPRNNESSRRHDFAWRVRRCSRNVREGRD